MQSKREADNRSQLTLTFTILSIFQLSTPDEKLKLKNPPLFLGCLNFSLFLYFRFLEREPSTFGHFTRRGYTAAERDGLRCELC